MAHPTFRKLMMEKLHYRFEHGQRQLRQVPHLVGVVSSGNLEVLVRAADLAGACEISINTAAAGFAAIWQAVLQDFHARWQLANVQIAINDVGATPAVVSLRLDQAIASCLGEEV